jgi:hypothetical protein
MDSPAASSLAPFTLRPLESLSKPLEMALWLFLSELKVLRAALLLLTENIIIFLFEIIYYQTYFS